MVINEGYEMFIVFDDVGGRYFVLIVVGLLLIVIVGINIEVMMNGVVKVCEELFLDKLEENIVY